MRGRQLLDFLIHLRPHYQLFILSGGYLAGVLLQPEPDFGRAIAHFFSVHLLLFGGATAYNSFHDKDEGPIGGLANPPKMAAWMHPASLIVQIPGLALGVWQLGLPFAIVYLSSMLFFWLYSTPHARWKGHPWLSCVAIAISTGTNSVLLGHLAAGGDWTDPRALVGALGVASVLLSMYPVSQLFQIEDDAKRGDRSFASVYGLRGVRRFFAACYSAGVAVLTVAFWLRDPRLAVVFLVVSVIAFLRVRAELSKIHGQREEYGRVMRLKYVTSGLFNAFLIGAMVALGVI